MALTMCRAAIAATRAVIGAAANVTVPEEISSETAKVRGLAETYGASIFCGSWSALRS